MTPVERLEHQCALNLLRMRLLEAEAKAARWAAWAARLEMQMRREGWTDEDFNELKD